MTSWEQYRQVFDAEILSATDPLDMKKAGDGIQMSHDTLKSWKENNKAVMKDVLAKFTQNEDARTFLLATDVRNIVEASSDRFRYYLCLCGWRTLGRCLCVGRLLQPGWRRIPMEIGGVSPEMVAVPELGVAPLINTDTELEHELTAPEDSPLFSDSSSEEARPPGVHSTIRELMDVEFEKAHFLFRSCRRW